MNLTFGTRIVMNLSRLSGTGIFGHVSTFVEKAGTGTRYGIFLLVPTLYRYVPVRRTVGY
jgi:hypothetical protein